jgi:hypothetical protein
MPWTQWHPATATKPHWIRTYSGLDNLQVANGVMVRDQLVDGFGAANPMTLAAPTVRSSAIYFSGCAQGA